MKKLFYLFAALLCPIFANAQYTVKGVVKDMANNEPVPNATIFVPHTPIAASTDLDGAFILQSRNNFDSIVIASVGYADQRLRIADKSQRLNIMLSPGKSLTPIEVIGVKQPESVTTLTQADLNRYSGLNLQDALNNVPGVNMESRSPWGGQHIIIRGYYPSADNGRTNGENFNGLGYQLYINNIPVTDATGTTIMDDIDFLNLGKVEVIKGPSPLYGSYIGGAVNLYTPTPAPNQTSINEEIIGGSYGLFRDNTNIQTATDKASLLINYGHQTYNGFRPNDGSQKDYANFVGNFNVSNKQTVSTYFSYNHSYEQLAGEIDSADFYGRKAISDSNYTGNNSHVEIQSFRAGVTDNYRINNHFGNETTLFTTGSILNQYFAHGFDKDESINFGGRTAFTYAAKGDKVSVNGTLGASFQRSDESAQGNFILPFIQSPFTASSPHDNPSDVQNYAMNYNIFTQWKVSLPAQFSVTVGASVNFVEFGTQNLLKNGFIYLNDTPVYRSYTPVFTPSASLIKVFNNNISAYASISMGYAPPTITDMTNTAGVVDLSLNPEKVTQYEIGTKGSLVNSRLSYQLAFFDVDIKNRLIQETTNDISYYTNAGEQRNLGAELYVSYDAINNRDAVISLVRPWISYAYSDFKYINFKNYAKSSTGGDTLIADYSGNKVAAVAPNVFNAGVDLKTKVGFYLNASYRYVDKVPVTFDNVNYMKSYNLLNARIGYTKDFGRHVGLDIFAGVDNILGSTYYNFIFVGQNIGELAQAKDGGGGDGYILPAPYNATFYGGFNFKYKFR